MRIDSFVAAILSCSIQLCAASAGELILPSEPVMRGTIRSSLSYGHKCLTVPKVEFPPGARLEMRPCQNSADQIFEWNVLSFEIKIHKLCIDALRSGQGSSQPGDPVGLWYCQGTQRQRWFPFRDSPRAPAISFVGGSNQNGNLCMNILEGGNADGANLVMSNCDGQDYQQFRIQSWPALANEVSSGPF